MRFTQTAVDQLEDLRLELGRFMPINSGYRCPDHPIEAAKPGGPGPHSVYADDRITVDVGVSGVVALDLVVLAPKWGFTGIGLRQHGAHADRLVHLDNLRHQAGRPRPWIWTYS